jgi:hypothetical protein
VIAAVEEEEDEEEDEEEEEEEEEGMCSRCDSRRRWTPAGSR